MDKQSPSTELDRYLDRATWQDQLRYVEFEIQPFEDGYLGTGYVPGSPDGAKVQVFGLDRDAVARYLEKLQVQIKVLANDPKPLYAEYGAAPAPRPQSIDRSHQPTKEDLVISIGIQPTNSGKGPVLIGFALDPPITQNVAHDYKLCNAHDTATQVYATGNHVSGVLYGFVVVPLDRADVDLDASTTLPPDEQMSSGVSTANPTCFCVRIIGEDLNNSYELTGVYRGAAYQATTRADFLPCI